MKRRRAGLKFAGLTALAVAGSSLIPLQWVSAEVVVQTRVDEVCGPAAGPQVRNFAFPATHVAVHWDGNPEADVNVSFSTDGKSFGQFVAAERDEVGEQRRDARTYRAVLSVDNALAVTVDTDRGIGRLCVLAMADGERKVERRLAPAGSPARGAAPQPDIKARSYWGADESLRFKKGTNTEIWPPEYHVVEKLLVHHTATKNRDRDPKATIRSMYRYHAVTQGWGDIGYNFMIDEAGTVYKGRHSHDPDVVGTKTTPDRITGDDAARKGVRAGHAYGFNAGTVGVALLGTLTNQDATASAKDSLVNFLAWEASIRVQKDGYTLDPLGKSNYVSPVDNSYYKNDLPNIAGHLDVNSTECPGASFYSGLETIRQRVAAIAPRSSVG